MAVFHTHLHIKHMLREVEELKAVFLAQEMDYYRPGQCEAMPKALVVRQQLAPAHNVTKVVLFSDWTFTWSPWASTSLTVVSVRGWACVR